MWRVLRALAKHAWARLRSVEDQKRVLIVQFREEDVCLIWIREAGGALWRLNKNISPSILAEAVEAILHKNKNTPFDLCIHDGVLHGKEICSCMLGQLNTAVANKFTKKVVHVTSLGFSLSTGGQVLDASGKILGLSLDSWRLEDYIEAITCQEFTKQMGSVLRNDKKALENYRDDDGAEPNSADDASDKIGAFSDKDKKANTEAVGEDEIMSAGDEMMDDGVSGDSDPADATWTDVIETKYFYAGGNARFMFQFPLSDLRNELDNFCNRVRADDWKYFASKSVASGTPTAVNALMQQLVKKASPVSQYVLFWAYEECKTDLVNAVKAAAEGSNYPALKSWAFELEQIDLIRLSLESPQANAGFTTNNDELRFRPLSSIDFDEKTFKNGTLLEDGTIIWCLKWNQGCFDVAFYQERTLVTLQFTVSEEHSLNPSFIRRLWDALLDNRIMVDNVVHVAVGEKATRFKVDTRGTGRQDKANKPQFTINAYCSPPLVKNTVPAAFQAIFSPALSGFSTKVDMWEPATTKKRRSGSCADLNSPKKKR